MIKSTTPQSRPVYLDYNSTTPLAEGVADSLVDGLHIYGNPSNLHQFGEEARTVLAKARKRVAVLIGAMPQEIVFTASGSESDNLAIKGSVQKVSGTPVHVITARTEHSAVLESCRYLETLGHEVTYLPVDGDGRVDPWDVFLSLRPNTCLISIMHANNEIGVLQPIEEIGAIARDAGVLFHTDACQSVGKVPVDVSKLPVDLLSFSGHKIYGPKGVGVLYMRKGVTLQPLVHGGRQENGFRAGTENVLGALGMGVACELALHSLDEEATRLRRLRDRLCQGLLALGEVRVNGDLRCATPGTLNVSFRYIKGDALATALSFQGIAVSTGSACHAGESKPSHVLRSLGIEEEWLPGAVRFSLGRKTTDDDIDYVLTVLPAIVSRLRAMSPLARLA